MLDGISDILTSMTCFSMSKIEIFGAVEIIWIIYIINKYTYLFRIGSNYILTVLAVTESQPLLRTIILIVFLFYFDLGIK